MIRFSDGTTLDCTGEYRVELNKDGYYVLGGNLGFAVDTREEGIEAIRGLDAKASIVLRYDEAKAKEPKKFFEIGSKYKIIEGGCRISGWKSIGPNAEQGWSNGLEIGDTVTYVGRRYSGGSDGITCMAFSVKNERGSANGIFWPNDWGRVSEGFFQKVEA